MVNYDSHYLIFIIWGWNHSRVVHPEVLYKGEGHQAICNHVQGISLSHPLLAVKKMTRPVARPNH